MLALDVVEAIAHQAAEVVVGVEDPPFEVEFDDGEGALERVEDRLGGRPAENLQTRHGHPSRMRSMATEPLHRSRGRRAARKREASAIPLRPDLTPARPPLFGETA